MQWRPARYLLICITCAGGCFRASERPSLSSKDPSLKIPAMRQAGEAGDTSAVAALVEALDCDDPAIRLYAFMALRQITGETFGYAYYHDEVERAPAIARWNDWLSASSHPK